MRAQRVLQVVLSLNPGGTERLVLELAARLHAEIPMHVVCLDDAGKWAGEIQDRGITVDALGRRPGFRPELGRAIARLAREHRATLIHAHQYSPFVYSCLSRLSGLGVPLVFTEHGRQSAAPPSSKRRAANLLLRRFAARVFAVSEELKRHMAAEGFSARSIEVIYNGIDVGPRPHEHGRAGIRAELGVSDTEFVIGTIGRLDPVKGFDTLMRAVARLPPALDPTLLIIGDGPEREALGRLADGELSGCRVRLIGHRDNARRYLPAFDVFVNSSESEGISLTILEAMAAALPVLVTRVGGTPEVIDESCGWLTPAGDPATMAAALVSIASQEELRKAMGSRARERVETRFTLDRMVGDYREVYLSATGRSEPAREAAFHAQTPGQIED